jgi:hypothetical protein
VPVCPQSDAGVLLCNRTNKPRTLVALHWSQDDWLSAPLRVVRKPSRRANLKYSMPRLGRPDLYRSGLPTRTLAAYFAGTTRAVFVQTLKLVDAF